MHRRACPTPPAYVLCVASYLVSSPDPTLSRGREARAGGARDYLVPRPRGRRESGLGTRLPVSTTLYLWQDIFLCLNFFFYYRNHQEHFFEQSWTFCEYLNITEFDLCAFVIPSKLMNFYEQKNCCLHEQWICQHGWYIPRMSHLHVYHIFLHSNAHHGWLAGCLL